MKPLMILLTSMLLFACGRESVMDDVGYVVDDAAEETADAVDEATDALNED